MNFFIASSRDAALAHLLDRGQPFAAVEAEWGDSAIDLEHGAMVAYNHHGSRAGRMCPSLAYNSTDPALISNVVLSHFDHDTLLGCMALMGRKPPGRDGFYSLSAFADIHGPHRITTAPNPTWNQGDLLALEAFWCWSETHRLRPPTLPDQVTDCTAFVETAAEIMEKILAGDADLLEAGARWAYANLELNIQSLKGVLQKGDTIVLMREGAKFVNHLYHTTDGQVAQAVVGHNTETGSVTVSLADPDLHKPFRCDAFVQSLWGREAGGHPGIAGSPRGQKMPDEEWHRAGTALLEALIMPIPVIPASTETEPATA